MPIPLMGDSLVIQFGEGMCIEVKASFPHNQTTTMNTTQYAECRDILWQEYPGTEVKVAIYKYIADCKNGKHGKQMAEHALRIS